MLNFRPTFNHPYRPRIAPPPTGPHRFAVGEYVRLVSEHGLRGVVSGRYTIRRLMPLDGTIPTYRVKSDEELFERLVPEHLLRALPEPGEMPPR